jgi:hypothetical protein
MVRKYLFTFGADIVRKFTADYVLNRFRSSIPILLFYVVQL